MNFVYSVSIPIPDYNRTEVFEQQLLFDNFPSKEDVVNEIMSLIDLNNIDSMELVDDLLYAIYQIEEWFVFTSNQISENTHVNVKLDLGNKMIAKNVKSSFSIKKIVVRTTNK